LTRGRVTALEGEEEEERGAVEAQEAHGGDLRPDPEELLQDDGGQGGPGGRGDGEEG